MIEPARLLPPTDNASSYCKILVRGRSSHFYNKEESVSKILVWESDNCVYQRYSSRV